MANPEVVPRSYWTSASRGGSSITSSQVRGIAYHWPASAGSFGVESKSKVASRLRGWRNFHVNGRGWSDIGYNLGVDQAGRVWDLRGLYRVGAHAASTSNPSANKHYIGILLIMGMSERPTAAMIRAFQYARTVVVYDAHGRDANDLLGHRQVPGAQTSCPGDYQISIKGTLDNTYEEDDDMPTAKEIAEAVWSYRIPNRVSGGSVEIGTLLSYMHEDGVQASTSLTQRLADPEEGLTPRQAWSAAEKRTAAILDALKDIPGVDVAALAAELNRIDAEAFADALADEQSQRLAE